MIGRCVAPPGVARRRRTYPSRRHISQLRGAVLDAPSVVMCSDTLRACIPRSSLPSPGIGVRSWLPRSSPPLPCRHSSRSLHPTASPGYPLPVPPKAGTLALTYTAPELVQRRGLASRRFIRTDNIDALFLVHAIRQYLAHPQRRSAIGTQTEYDYLLRALTEPTAVNRGASERRQQLAPPANEDH
jgi:hypothetical protein